MKRDMDLCREILKRVEAHPRGNEAFMLQIDGHGMDEITYHVKLLNQAGLVEAITTNLQIQKPVALTWAGCEFVEATRDDEKWTRVKAKAMKATGSVGFEVVKAIASAMTDAAVKAVIGQP
jgi:Hypothetical protein (DUF2513)